MNLTQFSQYAERIASIDSGIEKRDIVVEALMEADDDIGILARFLQGNIFPEWDERTLGVKSSLVYDALAEASGKTSDEISSLVAEEGDPGTVCERLDLSADTGQVSLFASTELTLASVYDNFQDIAAMSGAGSQSRKVDSTKSLLLDASSTEAKYITRLILGKMRIGVGPGTIRDAVALAFDCSTDLVERGIMVTNDVETVAKTARSAGNNGLQSLKMEVERPVEPMLAQKSSKNDAINSAGYDGEVAVEIKYDGARLQCHVNGETVRLFTRNMNEVTDSLPDVCEILRDNVLCESAIIDCEVVAYDSMTDDPLPFQEVMKRLRRKYDIEEKQEEINLSIYAFDVLSVDGAPLLDETLRTRGEMLNNIITKELRTERWYVTTIDEIADIESEALSEGHEGVMVKNPNSTYKPSNRGKNWLKIKPDVETLDCVVVGGEWGKGRRANFIGTYMLAVRDQETDELKRVGKVATGITDSQLAELTDRFKPLIVSENGERIEFKPDIVFEVGCEEIQQSPQYESGFGLRFPRFIAVREDKYVDDSDTVERLQRLYKNQ